MRKIFPQSGATLIWYAEDFSSVYIDLVDFSSVYIDLVGFSFRLHQLFNDSEACRTQTQLATDEVFCDYITRPCNNKN